MEKADKVEMYKQEYIKLKDEQTKRIGFRDNLLYVNLVLVSGIMSFAFSKDPAGNPYQLYALLLAAWVALILGWTYVVNDQKISAIGQYTRERLKSAFDNKDAHLFGFEWFHTEDNSRERRKIEQLIIDLLSFVAIGILAVSLFLLLAPDYGRWSVACAAIEIFLLVVLGCEIAYYANIRPHKRKK